MILLSWIIFKWSMVMLNQILENYLNFFLSFFPSFFLSFFLYYYFCLFFLLLFFVPSFFLTFFILLKYPSSMSSFVCFLLAFFSSPFRFPLLQYYTFFQLQHSISVLYVWHISHSTYSIANKYIFIYLLGVSYDIYLWLGESTIPSCWHKKF